MQKILIIDFGSQYTQLIARRVREIGVYCEIYLHNASATAIRAFDPNGIILSGGPDTVYKKRALRIPEIIFKLGCPVLGICYGMQALAQQLGGAVKTSTQREFGATAIKIKKSLLFAGIDAIKPIKVWMSHNDKVVALPKKFQTIAQSTLTKHTAMADEKRRYYGVQFHPEVTHTPLGKKILTNFARKICGCSKNWTTKNIVKNLITQIQTQVGTEKVVLGLSGGVDSAVVALLLQRAIGKQVICIFVDTGLLRLNETKQIKDVFARNFHLQIKYVDAKKQFLSALNNVTNPEQKRKIIGAEFIKVFEKAARKLPDVKWLAQGTIYPDVIESTGIKSHHNVGGLPKHLKLNLLEPLRDLFKDEVRNVGRLLGMPDEILYRHPFPGPGLAVRIIGAINQKNIDILQKADAIFIEELKNNNWYHKTSQAFVVFLPIKSVAVMGDLRNYSYVLALRAVVTTDFMTAIWADLPYKLLHEISRRILNEVPEVSRVVYDVTGKPPATIEWE